MEERLQKKLDALQKLQKGISNQTNGSNEQTTSSNDPLLPDGKYNQPQLQANFTTLPGGGSNSAQSHNSQPQPPTQEPIVDTVVRSVSSVFLWEHVPPGLQFRTSEDGQDHGLASVRLIARGAPFYQSAEPVHIDFRWTEAFANAKLELFRILARDIFHYIISFSRTSLYFFLTAIYTAQVLIFAGIYYGVNKTCDTTPDMDFQSAFAFSLETSTTVGYTLPFSNDQIFFAGCVSWTIVIYLQMVITMMLNAVVVGIVLIRVARADRRALKMLFSDKACIICIRGKYYFMFQAFDLDAQYPVVGAQVRMYAVFHESSSSITAHFQTRAMRTLHPDDEIGGKLFLSVPATVIHHIDGWSALMPPSLLKKIPGVGTNPEEMFRNAATKQSFPGRVLREADGFTGARMLSCCPACGETFLNYQYLVRHIEYNQLVERSKDESFWGKVSHTSIDVALLNAKCLFVPHRESTPPVTGSKSDALTTGTTGTMTSSKDEADGEEIKDKLPEKIEIKQINLKNYASEMTPAEKNPVSLRKQVSVDEAKEEILKHLEETKLEIIVIVEGIDPRTSNTFQARHSYCATDIVFDRLFVPCMSVSKEGTAEVDLSLFHQTMPVPSYIDEPPPVASHS